MSQLLEYFQHLDTIPVPPTLDKYDDCISFWKYEMLSQCPYKFLKVGMQRDKTPSDSRNALEGSVLHALMDGFIRTGTKDWSWPLNNFNRVFDAVLSEAKIIHWKTDPPDKDMASVYDVAKAMVEWSTEFLRLNGILDYPSVNSEAPFKVRVLPDLLISGRVDLWVKPPTGGVDIYDWKGVTDASRPKKAQMMFYALGLYATTRHNLNAGYFVCPRINRTVICSFTENELLLFIEALKGIRLKLNRMKETNKYPRVRGHMCKYCGLDEECVKAEPVTVRPKDGAVSFGTSV